jgi:glyoxylase-like metal-dependent hydrolase (beta-lactamase superfamily II)
MNPHAQEIAPGVSYISAGIANLYVVGQDALRFILVDAGMHGYAESIRKAIENKFGPDAAPLYIVLTHGHFDHAGSAAALAKDWHVPVYAHPMELPYLTGKSNYPPPDPTVGGAMSLLGRFFPNRKVNLSGVVHPLGDSLPAMDEWQVHFTPGHTPGHVSFFRPSDRTLLAGDAFTTVDLDSFGSMATKKQEVSRPPAYFTCDWQKAHESVEHLSDLAPRVLAAGHGIPMSGAEAGEQLRALAEQFPIPEKGRYVSEPARADVNGITYLPPPISDPLPKVAAGIGVAAAAAGVTAALVARSRKVKREKKEREEQQAQQQTNEAA